MTTALLNVDVFTTDVTAVKAALIAHHIIPVATCELKANRKGYSTLILSVQGYWHTRLAEALHRSSSASIVAVLCEDGKRFTCGKATLLREVSRSECAILNLWGQPV